MEKNNPKIIHDLNNNVENSSSLQGVFIILFTALILGVLTGFIITKFNKTASTGTTSSKETVKKSVGIADKKTFKDNAEGILREGGIEGEGNYHLERKAGDASQNAYLTSSTVDLSEFVGKKVRVWGETFNGKKAGWLMDVGLVEIL